MTKTRSVEEFETSLVQLYYKSDILFKYGASRNFEWNRKRELEWDRIFTVLRKLHNKEVSKIQTVFQLKTKIWKLIQMTKKKYQRHLLFPAYPKKFSKVEKLILKYEGISSSALPQTNTTAPGTEDENQNIQPATTIKNGNVNEILQKSKEKVEYWLSYKFIVAPNDSQEVPSDAENLASPTSLYLLASNPYETLGHGGEDLGMEVKDRRWSETSTQQLVDTETAMNESEEKLLFCNANDPQVAELLRILKENEKQNAEINALRLERERIELEEAKIRLTLAEEEATRKNSVTLTALGY